MINEAGVPCRSRKSRQKSPRRRCSSWFTLDGSGKVADGRRVRLGEEPTDTVVQRVVRTALPTAILVVVHGSVRTAPAHSS